MEDIFLPVLEASVIYASHYCKICGRNTLTSSDLEYGIKHAAMTYVGKKIGTHFPEIYDDDSESEEEYEDEEDEFTRYEGIEDETCIQMNTSYDSWDSWEPYSPAEKIIKNAIDKHKNGWIHSK